VDKKKKAAVILEILKKYYPDAVCSLDYDGIPFHLFVSAILSAQCTDKRVNEVVRTLFKEYPAPADFAAEREDVIGEKIRTCGLFRAKAHALVVSSQMLIKDYEGRIPSDVNILIKFPGVGRKVANLIAGEIYGIPGIVVDTHCGRVAKRLGLTSSDSPARIEKDLGACIPEAEWIKLGHRLVAHGRTLCTARNPKCPDCPAKEVCTYAGKEEKDKRTAARKRAD